MEDWLQTIATAGFGALLAWLAAFIERKSSRDHEERKLKREKAEQAFVEIGAMERSAMQFLLWAASVRTPEAQAQTPERFDPARLTGLISMYFPEGMAVLERHDARATEIVTSSYKDQKKSSAAKEIDQFHTATASAAIRMQSLTTETAKLLRQVVQRSAGATRLKAAAGP